MVVSKYLFCIANWERSSEKMETVVVGDEVSIQAACLNSYHTKTCDCRERHSPAIRRERESAEFR